MRKITVQFLSAITAIFLLSTSCFAAEFNETQNMGKGAAERSAAAISSEASVDQKESASDNKQDSENLVSESQNQENQNQENQNQENQNQENQTNQNQANLNQVNQNPEDAITNATDPGTEEENPGAEAPRIYSLDPADENAWVETEVESGLYRLCASLDAEGNPVFFQKGLHTVHSDIWNKNVVYYTDEDGVIQTGIVTLEDGNRHYFSYMNSDGTKIPWGDDTISFGQKKTGWRLLEGTWYFFNKTTGILATGWLKSSGNWYYLDPKDNGKMITGLKQLGSNWYYFQENNDGKMLTGWQKIDGNWYLFKGNNSGKMLRGWQKVGKYWYYMDPQNDGRMLTGWQKINGYWFYMNETGSGRMLTGWQKVYGKWYYLKSSGRMLTGWQKVGKYWYYLRKNGSMVSNEWYNGYYLRASGAWEQNRHYVESLDVANTTNCIIVVEGSGTRATVSMFKKQNGSWNRIFSTSSGYLGSNGLGKTVEGDRKTPVGVFTMDKVFGIKSNPGSPVGYTKVNSTHYWVGDSNSSYYNQFVSTNNVNNFSKSVSEHLIDYTTSYNYCINMGYNSSCTPRKGSALFLHCTSYRTTAGCVAIPETYMVQAIQNLEKGAKIIIGTRSQLLTY